MNTACFQNGVMHSGKQGLFGPAGGRKKVVSFLPGV
jgi:hypothetical protein